MQEKANSEINEQETDGGLESLFAQAEALIERLEDPELPLEDAFEAYEKGMKIIQACNSRIDRVEQKMLVMNEEGGLTAVEDMPV